MPQEKTTLSCKWQCMYEEYKARKKAQDAHNRVRIDANRDAPSECCHSAHSSVHCVPRKKISEHSARAEHDAPTESQNRQPVIIDRADRSRSAKYSTTNDAV